MWNGYKEIWKDIMQHHILTISTICGVTLIYVKIWHPEIYGDISQIVAQYLITKREQ